MSEIYKEKRSLTTQYLSGNKRIETPSKRRDWKHFVKLDGINVNNIKKMDVKIPLDCLTLITGVSGSGKSSLIKEVLKPAS